MALILDTNALSAFAEGDAGILRVIESQDELALPAVVLGEYLFGVRQSRRRAAYEQWLRDHLAVFSVLPVGLRTAERYADIRAELKAAGNPIPMNDLWVAALAREHDSAIVTRDLHFKAVSGLRVVAW
jgi:predicted nucleic acid-binding protein